MILYQNTLTIINMGIEELICLSKEIVIKNVSPGENNKLSVRFHLSKLFFKITKKICV